MDEYGQIHFPNTTSNNIWMSTNGLIDLFGIIYPTAVIGNWMRNRNTIEYLGIWESLYNPQFKPLEFEGFKKEAGLNAFTLSPHKWINATYHRDYFQIW